LSDHLLSTLTPNSSLLSSLFTTPSTTPTSPLSLHDALPISPGPYPYQHLFDYLDNRSNLSPQARTQQDLTELTEEIKKHPDQPQDRKSTRLNSSHGSISYAVFCLKKKKKEDYQIPE